MANEPLRDLNFKVDASFHKAFGAHAHHLDLSKKDLLIKIFNKDVEDCPDRKHQRRLRDILKQKKNLDRKG